MFFMAKLEQIEADVVILLRHNEGTRKIMSYWECEKSKADLEDLAAKYALELTEELGCGDVTYAIYDHRDKEILNKL